MLLTRQVRVFTRSITVSAVATCFTLGCTSTPAGDRVDLPSGSTGIGFDDLRYSATLHRVLVPGGRSGNLDLIDPDRLTVTSIGGFSTIGDFSGGHDDGPTSVDEGKGFLYVTDRTSQTLDIVDPQANAIVSKVPLGSNPDYVRFVAPTNELWVSEPGEGRLEVFSLSDEMPPAMTHAAFIAVANGPESLVIDTRRGKAYTHRWQSSTVVLDLATRAIIAEWPNGCASSRGIALDETRGFLFAACLEGTTSVFDVDHGGAILSSAANGSGFDVIGYNPTLGHLHLAGSACRCLVTLGVSAAGKLSFLERHDAPADTHCATADDVGHAWVCDPKAGALRRVTDSYPSTF
jgi:DNA-binding beta-propeller fold protein YncE